MSAQDDKNKLYSLMSSLGSSGNSLPSPDPLSLAAGESGLFGIFARPEAHNLYYNGKTVILDGYSFIGCRFDYCILRISSLNFELKRCVIDPSTRIEYGESVTRILRLFLGRYDWAYGHFDEYFLPTRNPDGSITISRGA